MKSFQRFLNKIFAKFLRGIMSIVSRFYPVFGATLFYRLIFRTRARRIGNNQKNIIREAKRFDIRHKGRRVRGYRWGNSGKMILLVHGWESMAADFSQFIPALIDNGYQVVSFDAPGHGRSEGKRSSLILIKEVIDEMIALFGVPYAIIGHSLGGSAAAYCLSEHGPESQVGRLVTIGSPATPGRFFESGADMLGLSQKSRDRFYQMVEDRLNISITDFNIGDFYGKMAVDKVMIVHSRSDALIPFSEAQQLSQDWSGAAFEVRENVGHYNLIQDRPTIDRVVDFLKAS